MGTCYYARKDACPHCGRADTQLHIGKSSYGWSFTFRGYRDTEPTDSRAYQTFDEQPIESWARWQEVLSDPTVRIFDECGVEISFADFKAKVESKRGGCNFQNPPESDREFRRRSDSFASVHRVIRADCDSKSWIDADGEAFHAYEFS